MAKRKQSKNMRLARLIPNAVTIFGLCIGLSAIRFALKGQYELAVGFVIFASCIDGIDGRLARLLDACSEFGAQLDSLADFLNFGVAPSFVLYLWKAHEIKGVGWALVLLFVICAAIRLARFNSELDAEEAPPPWAYRFFKGIPAPAGAMVSLGPCVVTFAFQQDYPNFFAYVDFVLNPWFVIAYAGVTALLMASEFPTFSLKKIVVPRRYVSLVLVAVGVFIICAFTEPWLTMVGVGLWYYSTLPLSLAAYMRASHQNSVDNTN